MVENPKKKAVRDASHLDFIRGLPCLVCNAPPRSQACHIRRGSFTAGMGVKPDDHDTVPMCHECHNKQHLQGELTFWHGMGGYEAARVLARKLHEVTGDKEQALGLMLGFK